MYRIFLFKLALALSVMVFTRTSADAQNFERYKPPTLPPSPAPSTPDLEPNLPPVTGSDEVLINSLDAIIVYDDGAKVDPDDAAADATGLIYQYPDTSSLVYSGSFQQVVNSYLNRPVSLRSINQLSRDIIDLYRYNEQPIIDVRIPEQRITGGTLKIVVVEGRIGAAMYRGLEYSKPESLDRWLTHSWSGNRIYEPWVEEDLFWLNQNRFRRVTIDLAPGTQEGTTDLFFDVDEVFPVRGYVGYENTGVATLGLDRLIAGFIYGNLFGVDGVLSYQHTTDAEMSQVNAHSMTYSQPIDREWSVGAYGSWSTVEPTIPGFNQTGTSWLLGGTVTHTLEKSYTIDENVSAGIEFKTTNNNLEFGGIGIANTRADLAQINFGYDYFSIDRNDEYVRVAADAWFGIGPGFSDYNDVPSFNAIRANSSPDYCYFRASYEEAVNFGSDDEFQFLFKARGQIASERLLFSENLGFGGYDTIRGYDQWVVSGDHGWQTNMEIGPRPAPINLGGEEGRFRVFAFADMGQAFVADPFPGQNPTEFLAGTGLGCQLSVGQSVNFRFDYAAALTNVAFQRKEHRAHIGLIWLFGPTPN